MGPRHWCEGGEYIEHEEIEKAMNADAILEEKIQEYSMELILSDVARDVRTRIKRVIKDSRAVQELLRAKVERLRSLFTDKALHNVEGITGEVTPIVIDAWATRSGGEKISILNE
jgi:hypothetical protein